ncbi:MAG: TolC family protein [Steroidobacteraceae bacterium]
MIERTLAANPELDVLRFQREARQGQLQQTQARMRPEINAAVENFLGSGERSGISASETTLSLGLILERGARARRIAVAEAGTEQAEVETRIRRLDLAAEAARRFVTVLQGQSILTSTREGTRLFEETAKAVAQQVAAARAPDAEQARAEAQLALSRLTEEQAEHELASAKIRLTVMWGAMAPDFATAAGDLDPPPKLVTYEEARNGLERNGDLVRLLSEKRLREAEVHLAAMKSRPPWRISAGVRHFENDGDDALVLGLSIPLASRELAEGASREARARVAEVDARSRALRLALEAEFYALYQDLNHKYTELETLDKEVLPRIGQAAQQTRYAYDRGRYGYVELVAAQRELLEARLSRLATLAQLHQHRIEIERLIGSPLGGH